MPAAGGVDLLSIFVKQLLHRAIKKIPEEGMARKIWAWPLATPGIFGGKKHTNLVAAGEGGVDFYEFL